MKKSEKCGDVLLYSKRKDIGEIVQKYKNMKNISSTQLINYYKSKNIENFDISSSQYHRIVNGEFNFRINTLLKVMDILNLEIVIKPKKK